MKRLFDIIFDSIADSAGVSLEISQKTDPVSDVRYFVLDREILKWDTAKKESGHSNHQRVN